MSQDQYVIRGGADGRERLRMLSRVLQSGTDELFARVGVTPGWTCVDIGCGGGDVTTKLAALVGSTGRVLGFDIDSSIVAIAQREAADRQLSNVSFHNSDANSFVVEEPVDLIYSRFLLTHLPDPARVLRRMMQALKPGGVLIVEDIDFSGHFFYPESSAFRRFIEFYRQIVHKRGGDPTIGLRLPTLLLDAACVNVQIHVEQPAGLSGEVKFIDALTCEYIADALVAEGLLTRAEIEQLAEEMYDFARNPRTLVSLPRIIQAWGYRAMCDA